MPSLASSRWRRRRRRLSQARDRTSARALVTLKFNTFPIRYFVTNRDVPGVTAPQLRRRRDARSRPGPAVPNVACRRSSPASPARTRERRQRQRDRVSRPAGPRSRARVDVLHGRHGDRRDHRVRHLLQLDLRVVGRGGGRAGPAGRRVDRAARDRAPARARPLDARRDRADRRRPARARRRGGDVPDRVHVGHA